MSRSRTRKSVQKKNTNYSEEYLVGYVLDGESTEMIMKKFEAMEQIQKAKANVVHIPVEGSVPETKDEVAAPSFSAEDYKEIFKQTSTFTSQMVSKGEVSVIESFDAINYQEADFFSAVQDYIVSEDDVEVYDDNIFWDDDYEDSFGRKKKGLGGHQQRREIYEVTGEDGFVYSVKRKAKVYDPLEPQLIKIPPEPVPLSWAQTIKPFQDESDIETPIASFYYEEDIISFDFKKLKNKEVQAILADPPWKIEGSNDPRRIAPEDLKKINWNSMIPNIGFLFIWTEKEHIHQTVRTLEKLGFVYAENFVWVKQAVNNVLHADHSKYFSKSKVSLLIFKKGNGKLELRHQRNPDVVFDFVRHDKELTEDKPEFAYHVIETLLPTANYSEASPNPKLVELWAKKGQKRTGWITMVQK